MVTDATEKLIAATQELMLRKGYQATGLNEICRHAGVSKGAIYHSFDSKEALTLSALERFFETGLGAIGAIDVSDVEPRDRMIIFVDRVAEQAPYLWEHGCLLGGLASEMALASDVLQASVSEHFDQFKRLVASLAEPFVATLASEELTADDLAEEFLELVEGSIVMSRAYRDPQRIRVALERFAIHLRHLPRA